jgi:hypothetical protein
MQGQHYYDSSVIACWLPVYEDALFYLFNFIGIYFPAYGGGATFRRTLGQIQGVPGIQDYDWMPDKVRYDAVGKRSS